MRTPPVMAEGQATLIQQRITLMKEQIEAIERLRIMHRAGCRWGAGLAIVAGVAPWVADSSAQWPLQVAYGMMTALCIGISWILWRSVPQHDCPYSKAVFDLQERLLKAEHEYEHCLLAQKIAS